MLISFATYEASINFRGSFKLKSTLFGHPFGQETMGAFLMGFLDRLYRGEFWQNENHRKTEGASDFKIPFPGNKKLL